MNVRAQAEEARRKISARINKVQDEERRHIARELHDSIGQTLAALKMTVTPLSSIAPAGTATSKRVHEVNDLIDEAIRQTRTVSHLLHPPLLEELGFASAASWYVTEFSRRSGIEVNLDLPNDPPRFADSTELALYRVVQESLTNILRHSESRKAEVRLEVARSEISLSVKDYGKGMTKGQIDRIMKTAGGGGVGLRGMQERIADLGGTVELQSTGTGTTVKAILPLTKSNRNGAVGIESQTTGLSANATEVRVKPS
jgi:signal transduction histidine kinase